MREKRKVTDHQFLISKTGYIVIGIGILLIVLGNIAMMGGATTDPSIYPAEELYGFRRTILAPMLILLGLGLQAVAILLPFSPEEQTIVSRRENS